MSNVMGLALFVLGLVSIMLGLAIIVKERVLSKNKYLQQDVQKKFSLIDQVTNFIKALADFAEKLLGQFASAEKMPVFLIAIGLSMCVIGLWII